MYSTGQEVVQMHPLTRRRQEKMLSMQELADAAGIDKASISRIESGEVRHPWPKTLRALAKALECNPTELIAPPEGQEVSVGQG
jgi:transcriptional regulator with XRE-family HTH domain